jgi:hypothetical protein
MDAVTARRITVTVNGEVEYDVEARRLLIHFPATRPDRDARRLRHRQLRRVLDPLQPARQELRALAQADGATTRPSSRCPETAQLTPLQRVLRPPRALGGCTPGC